MNCEMNGGSQLDKRVFGKDLLGRDVDLAFYFNRGDCAGEGGSEQDWDSRYLPDLRRKIVAGRTCVILTDGGTGGLYFELKSKMSIIDIPNSNRGRKRFPQ